MTNSDFNDRVKEGVGVGFGYAAVTALFGGSVGLGLAGLALIFGAHRAKQKPVEPVSTPRPVPSVLDPSVARNALLAVNEINQDLQAQQDRLALERAWLKDPQERQ